MKKESPILFSTDMVKAIDDDIKTQTRRSVKDCPWLSDEIMNISDSDLWTDGTGHDSVVKCKFGKKGDLLFVRETYRVILLGSDKPSGYFNLIEYMFGEPMIVPKEEEHWFDKIKMTGHWRPSIHLPKWASRYWLEIGYVKAERLHDITLEDMKAEGVTVNLCQDNKVQWLLGMDNSALSFLTQQTTGKSDNEITEYDIYFAHWAALWSKINGRESWDSNPWVWVVEFKKVDHAAV